MNSRSRRTGPLVIVGDSLLDVDLAGRAERLCPDAPVPVVDLDHQLVRPGGAGLAALLAARAGIPVVLISAMGSDEAGDTLLHLLAGELDVLRQPLRGQTVVKTRIRTDGTTLARVDVGDGTAAGPLSSAAARAIDHAGAVLVCDYGREMTRQPELRRLLRSRPDHLPLVWDPHPRGTRPVAGTTLVTPNESEANHAAADTETAHARGCELRERWEADAVAVTIGDRGALLSSGTPTLTTHIPLSATLYRHPDAALDTCGAGDRFAVSAVVALRAGESLAKAVALAVEEAAHYVLGGGATLYSTEVGPRPLLPRPEPYLDAITLIERTRRAGGRVVATGGCFDLLHRGHIDLLQRARALGDLLVVCLNSDSSVKRAKGPGRPVVPEQDRARVLRALAAVDAVAMFDEDDPAELLGQLRPDVWVKGADYKNRRIPEAEVITRHGGRIVFLPLVSGYSTTHLVNAAQLAGTAC